MTHWYSPPSTDDTFSSPFVSIMLLGSYLKLNIFSAGPLVGSTLIVATSGMKSENGTPSANFSTLTVYWEGFFK